MPAELLIGRPASGKTETCIKRIKNFQLQLPIKTIWVLVPDRYQAAAFRYRLAQSGGAFGVQVGRFEDISMSLLERAGQHIPVTSLPLQNRIIRESIHWAAGQELLTHFSPIRNFPGFVIVLRDIFSELKRELLSPDQFLKIAEQGSNAHKEIGVLYEHYKARLEELNLADAEDVQRLAVSLLKSEEKSAFDCQMIIVDGFDQFTGAQYQLLKLFSQRVDDLLITMTGSAIGDRIVHRRFTESIAQLKNDLTPKIVPSDDEPRLPEISSHLERSIFESGRSILHDCQSPILLEARSPADEAREALRWIKGLVVRESVYLDECAIFSPNPSVYNPLLKSFAAEFGIPIRFSLDEPLENSAAIAALMNLLSLPSENFKSRSLINILRSPYFDFSFLPQEVHTLETISQIAQIIEGRDQWKETWQKLKTPPGQHQNWLDDDRNSPLLPREAEAGGYENLLNEIFDLITPPERSFQLSEWIHWLQDLLENLHFFENAYDERDRSALDTFIEILGAMMMSESIAGDQTLDFQKFISELFSLLRAEGYRESKRGELPDLLIGRMTEARGVRFQAVALLGLAEGSFPVVDREDPFLDEDLRQVLGLESRLQREQAGIFYQAITRADKHLLITRPYLAEDGENWEPSAYWKMVSNLLTGHSTKTINPEKAIPLCEAGSKQEMLFAAIRQKTLPKKYSFLEKNWRNLQHAQIVLKARRSKETTSLFEGNIAPIQSSIANHYFTDHTWSASQLESYAICPFYFYAGRTLGLEPREAPEPGINSRQLGSMLHEIMELTYKKASDTSDLSSLLTSLNQQAEMLFSLAPEKYGFRPSALWKFEQAQLLIKLEKTIRALEEDGKWKPLAFEQTFGIGKTPPLEISLDGITLVIRGVIDRVDTNDQRFVRIIDYKTGSSHLGAIDLINGIRLQLPIYALAAHDALNLGTPVDGFYWWIQGARSGSLKLARFEWNEKKGFEAAADAVKSHLNRILVGIQIADFHPEPPSDGCPSYCPAAQWCWQYQAEW